MQMHVFASGSKGNATLFRNTETGKGILVDCGICKRDFLTRCDEVGFDVCDLESIFITHEHTDHTKGLGVVLRGLAKQDIHPRLYVSDEVRKASSEIGLVEPLCTVKTMHAESVMYSAVFTVYAFATSHDSSESYGFRVEDASGEAIGYLTDSGMVSEQALHYLKECRVLALESNHDEKMLAEGDYPYIIKRRISSDRGHLSNTQAQEVLERLLCDKLEQVVAMHVSENNNTYRLPEQELKDIVSRNSHQAFVQVAYQHMRVSVE